MMLLATFLLLSSIGGASFASIMLPKGVGDAWVESVSAVLEATSKPDCSVIIITDGTIPSYPFMKLVDHVEAPLCAGVFEVVVDSQDANVTQDQISQVVDLARKVRKSSWCSSVVLVSEDPSFVSSFAHWSLKGRLLVWSTRLLLLTRLPLQHLNSILAKHWTFSMMNAMVLVLEDTQHSDRCVLYSHLPYGARGAETVPVAFWSSATGLTFYPSQRLFPEKFRNFHGATVNVTGLPWPPYFIEYEETAHDGTSVKKYKGPEGLLFRTIAQTLNFTFSLLPVRNWREAADRVVERKSLMLVVSHVVLQTRAERYDFSHAYAFTFFGFGLAKPQLQPQWQSLYYPLADEVWASTLAMLFLMPAIMHTVTKSVWRDYSIRQDTEASVSEAYAYSHGSIGVGAMVQEVFGILMGQNLSKWLLRANSFRTLVTAWLLFSFVLGTVYRGNLTAALTLPKYPKRPETLDELVHHVDRVTMPPFGKEWKKNFKNSGSRTLEKLGDLMHLGPSTLDGLLQVTYRQAQLVNRLVFRHWTAKHLTKADGSNPLYFGRENIDPGTSAWPIPHDAPYKAQLDNIMMTVNEGGLYEKWTEDTLDETERSGRMEQRSRQEAEAAGKTGRDGSRSSQKALTIVHMQGPLLLFLLGLVVAAFTFVKEILTHRS